MSRIQSQLTAFFRGAAATLDPNGAQSSAPSGPQVLPSFMGVMAQHQSTEAQAVLGGTLFHGESAQSMEMDERYRTICYLFTLMPKGAVSSGLDQSNNFAQSQAQDPMSRLLLGNSAIEPLQLPTLGAYNGMFYTLLAKSHATWPQLYTRVGEALGGRNDMVGALLAAAAQQEAQQVSAATERALQRSGMKQFSVKVAGTARAYNTPAIQAGEGLAATSIETASNHVEAHALEALGNVVGKCVAPLRLVDEEPIEMRPLVLLQQNTVTRPDHTTPSQDDANGDDQGAASAPNARRQPGALMLAEGPAPRLSDATIQALRADALLLDFEGSITVYADSAADATAIASECLRLTNKYQSERFASIELQRLTGLTAAPIEVDVDDDSDGNRGYERDY